MRVACSNCGRPTDAGPRCDSCRLPPKKGDAAYTSSEWRRRRAVFLTKNLFCVLCKERGQMVRATVADHYPRSRKELVAAGVADPDDERFLRALCRACHGSRIHEHSARFARDPA
jgi:5-methylcytosine-specific restriction enzyme A